MNTPSNNIPPSDWQPQVREWLEQARQHPVGSPKRNYYLTKIIRTIAPKLWRVRDPYYADALQQTWLYFTQKVCTHYDPDRASIVVWLNVYLRFRHRDLRTAAIKYQQDTISIDAQSANKDGGYLRAIADLPSPDYGSLDLLEQVTQWIKTDPKGILSQTHLKGDPALNAQTLLLLRLPSNAVPWKDISIRFDQKMTTIASFYQRKCLPMLLESCHSEGIYD
jgi:hypothetical protein